MNFRRLIMFFLLIAVGGTVLLTGCGHDEASAAKGETLYTCGMHPQVIQNKPGNCPICGMKLTPVRKQGGAAPAANQAGRKIKYYKSSMTPGETSPVPRKDSIDRKSVV